MASDGLCDCGHPPNATHRFVDGKLRCFLCKKPCGMPGMLHLQLDSFTPPGSAGLADETRPSTPADPETRSHELLGRIANALEAIARAAEPEVGPRGVRFYVPGEDDAVREDGDG